MHYLGRQSETRHLKTLMMSKRFTATCVPCNGPPAVAIERDDERSDEALADPILEEIRTSGNTPQPGGSLPLKSSSATLFAQEYSPTQVFRQGLADLNGGERPENRRACSKSDGKVRCLIQNPTTNIRWSYSPHSGLRDEALGPRGSRHLSGSQRRLQNPSFIRTLRLEKQEFLRWIPTKLDSDENSEAAVKDTPRVEDVSKVRRSKR
ncbi:Uncharacterized protein FKW44_002299, partial [Caligus rogercresseyi]